MPRTTKRFDQALSSRYEALLNTTNYEIAVSFIVYDRELDICVDRFCIGIDNNDELLLLR